MLIADLDEQVAIGAQFTSLLRSRGCRLSSTARWAAKTSR